MKKIENCAKLGAYHSPNGLGGCYHCKAQGIRPLTLSRAKDVPDRRKIKRESGLCDSEGRYNY